MSYLCGRDLEIIEALVDRPDLKPSYEAVKGVLTWRDEWSFELSQEGLEKIYKLWIARSYIHNGIPFSSYTFNPDLLERVWSEARTQGFKWPGFNRLELSQEDREYYEEAKNSPL